MNKILLCAALLCVSLFSFAQTTIGVKAGGNINRIHINAQPRFFKYDVGPSAGFHLGAYFIPKAKGKSTMIAELQFSQRGYTDNSGQSQIIKLGYLEGSFLFSFTPIKWLGLELGPSFAYLLSATVDGTDIEHIYDTPLDIGVSGGIRGNVSKRVSLIARYYYGITEIDETRIGDDYINEYNRVLSFGVGVKVNKIHD